jgi:hypothetical protein
MIFPMRLSKFSGTSKFFAGVVVGAILFSGSAIAYNDYVSDNTPENGYLLCANLKTKAVTFPNKLTCPSGTKALDMGAVTGVEGPEGPMGPQGYSGPQGPQGLQGPAGSSAASIVGKVYWGVSSSSVDIVADGTINAASGMVRKIMYTLKSSDIPSGYYQLSGVISGLWGDSANQGSLLKCYFQGDNDYKTDGGTRWGQVATERKSWNNVNMVVSGDWSTSSDSLMYLVCKTSGTLKGLNVQVEATSALIAGKLP